MVATTILNECPLSVESSTNELCNALVAFLKGHQATSSNEHATLKEDDIVEDINLVRIMLSKFDMLHIGLHDRSSSTSSILCNYRLNATSPSSSVDEVPCFESLSLSPNRWVA
jgi:formylmethanofuran dehydrogenase subunit B